MFRRATTLHASSARMAYLIKRIENSNEMKERKNDEEISISHQ
jgi:hypothetical protein